MNKRVNWAVVWSVFLGIGAFVTVAILFAQASSWIKDQVEQQVQKQLRGPEVLRDISRMLMPSMIIDGRGSIIRDFGFSDMVSDLSVDNSAFASNYTVAITLRLKQHIEDEPLVSAMCPDEFDVTAERLRMNDWLVLLKYGSCSSPEGSTNHTAAIERKKYRIQWIR